MNRNEQPPKAPLSGAELPENVREQIKEMLLPKISELLHNDSNEAWLTEVMDFITVHELLQTLPSETDEQTLLTHFAPVLEDTSGDDADKLITLTYYLPRYVMYAQLICEQSPELADQFPTKLQDRAQFLSDHVQETLL